VPEVRTGGSTIYDSILHTVTVDRRGGDLGVPDALSLTSHSYAADFTSHIAHQTTSLDLISDCNVCVICLEFFGGNSPKKS
jgi:hypothetical protein